MPCWIFLFTITLAAVETADSPDKSSEVSDQDETNVVTELSESKEMNQVLAQLNQTQTQIKQMQDRIALLERAKEIKAAFRAHLAETNNVPSFAPIHFQLVESTGGGYNPITGYYTAPFSGWYTFECQLYPTTTRFYSCDLYQNGESVTRSGDGAYVCTIASTLHANAGDVFWMQTDFNADYYLKGHSFFSASLVVPDD